MNKSAGFKLRYNIGNKFVEVRYAKNEVIEFSDGFAWFYVLYLGYNGHIKLTRSRTPDEEDGTKEVVFEDYPNLRRKITHEQTCQRKW